MYIAHHKAEIFGIFAGKLLARSEHDPDALVRTHLGLVDRIARKIFGTMSAATPLEDLVQIGVIALIEAAQVFEMRGEAKFSTYASCRIRGAMIDELRHSATISRQALRNRRSFAKTGARLAGELGRPASDAEMAMALNITVAAYRKAAAATASLRYESIESSYSDCDSAFADSAPNAFENLEQIGMVAAVSRVIGDLPKLEARVMQLYYAREMSLEAIGELLGVTATRVCRIKKNAVERARRQLQGWA